MSKKVLKTILAIIGRVLQLALLFVLVFGILATVVGSMLGISMVKVAESSPAVNHETIMTTLNENSKILDRDGNLIEAIAYDEFREIVNYEDIPKHLIDAFVSIEDDRFWEHDGVSLRSIIRSVVENVNAGGIVQGGSTLTQQLVKNIYLNNEVSWNRKIKEMYMALQLETQMPKQKIKEKIIEAYLNRVFLGQHAYGIEAAAQTYFSKSVKDLNLAQSATLASMVQAPATYSLFGAYPPASVPEGADVAGRYNVVGMDYVAVKNDKVMERKDFVLDKMLEFGKITKSQYDEAKSFDVMASVKPGSKLKKEYPSQIANLIKDEAIEKIMDSKDINYKEAANLLYTGGLEIYTTIDWDIQAKLEEAYKDFAEFFSDRTSSGVVLGDLIKDDFGDIIDSNSNKLYYKKSNLLTDDNKLFVPEGWYDVKENGDVVFKSSRFWQSESTIYVKPFYTVNDSEELVTYRVGSIELPTQFIHDDEEGFRISGDYFKNVSDFYSIEDDRLIINDKYYSVEKNGTVQPQSASIILDSKTAEVLAILGNRGNSPDDSINRATDFLRPPGSSIKPLAAYAPAIETGRRLSDPVDDTPFMMLGGDAWPVNAYYGYEGIVTTREALYRSMNPPAVKVLNEIGIDTSKEFLAKFGIINRDHPERDNFVSVSEDSSHNDENLSLALGAMTNGLTVKDMASAYQTFANSGERVPSSIILKISSKQEDIYVNEHNPERVISKEANFLITDVLNDVVHQSYLYGTANEDGIYTAGKTGTTNDNNDYWFAGFNPYYTSAVWIGFDNAKITMNGNSSIASTFYGHYMNKILEGKEAAEFERPEGIVTETVSKIDGLLPSKLSYKANGGNSVYTEYFKEGTVPTEQSDAYVEVVVDKRNNLLATDKIPAFLKEKRVYAKRPIPYDPSEFGGIIPSDWKAGPPTTYSDLPWKEETKRVVLEDGSIQETTNKFDGSVVVKIIKKDGTIIIQTTTLDGKVTTSVTKPETNEETKQENKPESQQENNQEAKNRNNKTRNYSLLPYINFHKKIVA